MDEGCLLLLNLLVLSISYNVARMKLILFNSNINSICNERHITV